MAQTNISRANTDTSSKDNVPLPPEEGAGDICPVCKGAGFVHPALDSGKVDFSRVVPCRCSKGELRKKKTEYLEKYSNLGSLSQLTFDNLSPKGKTTRHSEPFASCHSERSEESPAAQDRLREESQGFFAVPTHRDSSE